MACRYTYKGKTYEAWEFDEVLRAMPPAEAAAFMPGVQSLPAAPFIDKTDKWVALALKRVIKMAVDGGYDKVAFVTGQQSADRYDLSKQVRSIAWSGRGNDTEKRVTIEMTVGNAVEFMVQPDGSVGSMGGGRIGNEFDGKRLDDIIGKEVADRIMAAPYGDMRGDGLKVGGEGMIAFYDRIVPAVAKDVLRKLGGGAMETVTLPSQSQFDKFDGMQGGAVVWTFDTRYSAERWAAAEPGRSFRPAAGGDVLQQPGFTITDTMRQRAAGGMPVFARAWHGTPYRGIERFDTEAIGTGEGNQAYGWGLYFASRREVADFYRRSLSGEGGRVFTKDGRTIESPADLAEAYFQPGRIVRGYSGADKVLQFQRTGENWLVQVVGVKANGEPMSSERPRWHSTQPDAATLRDVLEEDGWQASPAGQLYEVDIPDDSDMLQWDKPMSAQSERVRAALAPFLVEREADLRNLWRNSDPAEVERELRYALNEDGQAIYEQIGYAKGGDRAASEYLHSIGVKGIKYLDAMSRNGSNGSHNYVIFSGDDVSIAGAVFSRPPRHDPATTETLAKAGIRQPGSMRQHLAAAAGRAMQVLRSRAELMAEARQGALDQFHGIQRAVQRDLGGLPLDQDPYIAARLANGGSSSVMRALLLHGQAKWADNGQHLVKIDGTKGLLDILAPLGEDVHDWFGWMIGNRAARLMREGRENNFTADDIKRLQALATPEKKAAFQKAAMEYASFKRSVLDVAQAAGLINPETRKTWDYADYIPFYRQVDAGTDGVSAPRMGRKGLAGQSSGIRVLRGGEAALNDPIENLLMNFSRLIDASLKNNAIAKTIDLLQEAGSEAVHKVGYDFTAAIVPAEQMRKKLVEAGTPEQVLDAIPPEVFEGMAKLWALQAPSDPDVVRVMVGGKPQFYRVNDPLLLRSLTSFVPFDFPGLGLMRGAKRLLTSMVTATPEFLARNFIRDTVAAQAITREGFSPAKSFAGVVKSWRETGAAEAMLFAGASFGSGQVNAGDPAGTGAELRRALRARGLNAAGIDGYMASLLDTPAKLWEKWRNVTDAVENANREAVYEATLKGGGSATAAAYESKDLMDFSLRGSWPAYQLLADVVPFLNARVQGLYRLGRADPKRLAAVGGLLMVATMLLAMGNDGEDWYEELPDWDKDTNWHFRIGGQHFRIPKPFEIGVVFATIPERIGRSIKGLDNGSKTASRLWANVRDQLAFDPVPQLIRPVLNVWANWDTFRQAPIETERDEGKLAAQRYDARTSDTARVLAGAAAPVVNSLELSPKRMEYLVTGYFGTVGAYALGLSDMVVRKLDGKPQGPSLRADDVPLVKAFYRVDPARSTVYESDLYLMRQEVEKVYRSVTALKKDDPAAAVELATQEQDKLALRSVIVNATKRLAALRRQADAIYADTKMTPQEKRQRLDAIQVQKNAIAKQAATIPEALTAF